MLGIGAGAAVIASLVLQSLGGAYAWHNKGVIGASGGSKSSNILLVQGGTLVFGLRERYAGAMCGRYTLTPAPSSPGTRHIARGARLVNKPDFSESFWAAVDTPLGETWAARVVTVGVGWPFVWMRATHVEPRVQVQLLVPQVELSQTPPQGLQEQDSFEPSLVGLLGNIVVYGVIGSGVAAAIEGWRRSRQARYWARCVHCGYARRGLDYGADCPECGRAPATTDFTTAS